MANLPKPVRYALTLTTDGAQVGTGFSEEAVNGRILQMRYVPDATNPFATGADIVVTLEDTGVAILTQSDIGTVAYTKAPRQATHDTAGAAALYAAGGAAVNDFIYASHERIKLAMVQGGVTKTGIFYWWVG